MKFTKSITLAIVLLLVTSLTACSATTLSTVEGYVNGFLPIAEVIANLIIATSNPAVATEAGAIETKINTELKQIETLVASINPHNYTSVRTAVEAVVADVNTNLDQLLALAQVKNPASVAKVKAFVTLAQGILNEILAVLPANKASASELATAGVKIGDINKNYKKQFNTLVSEKTGDSATDSVLSKTHKFTVLGWHSVYPTFR